MPGWRLRVDADVAGAVDGLARLAGFEQEANEREGEPLLRLGEELLHAPLVDQVLQPGLLAVGAVAIVVEDANHGRSNGHRLVRVQQQAAIAGELLVPGDAAEHERESRCPAGTAFAPLLTRTARNPMSLVSATTEMAPPLSKATLNLRGRPYMSREFRM